MDTVIKVKNVVLIYKSLESFSIRKLFFRNPTKRNIINSYKALDNISFELKRGKVYGVIGDNGAGKSTLLRLLAGVMTPNTGQVKINCKKINLLALGIGFVKELSGRQNIYLNSMLLGFNKIEIEKKIDSIIQFSELGDFIDRHMKVYSSGMVSRLGFSIAINMKPDVLLIDEILSVGDINFRSKSYNAIKEVINNKNITVVLVSHSLNQIKELCDEVLWLDKGKLKLFGNANEVIDKYISNSKS